MSASRDPFWKRKTLHQMTRKEWESLCDGCGKCCLHKLEDAETGQVHYTNVACRLLNLETVRCTRYSERHRLVANCADLTPDVILDFDWLPETCAYRLVARGEDLPGWHPLVSGDPETVYRAGISVRGRVVSERVAGDLEDHVVGWVE